MGSARHDIRCLAASAVGVPSSGAMSGAEALFVTRGRDILKSAEEIMEILDAYDLTGSLRDSAELVGCSHHTVKRYVEARDKLGGPPSGTARRPQLIDDYLDKVEEWVERSKGKVRADRVHQKLEWLGYTGSERTTRRAVAAAKAAFRVGNRRVHRPWVTEPGMWLQYDYGDGPLIDGVKTVLFVAWVAWSRFRVVLPLRDKTLPSVFAALDVTFRRIGGVPTYVLTDNEKTVTSEHIAGIPVRNQQLVAFASHYAVTVHTCVPADPASKGGTESSVKLAKADLVPTEANLRDAYDTFADLEAACEAFCDVLSGTTLVVPNATVNGAAATGCNRGRSSASISTGRCGSRWPPRSSWHACSTPPTSTGHWGMPPSTAASPKPIWPPSSTTTAPDPTPNSGRPAKTSP